MKFLQSLRKLNKKKEPASGDFAEFFANASKKEKIKVIRDAALMANEEQRELVAKARLKADQTS